MSAFFSTLLAVGPILAAACQPSLPFNVQATVEPREATVQPQAVATPLAEAPATVTPSARRGFSTPGPSPTSVPERLALPYRAPEEQGFRVTLLGLGATPSGQRPRVSGYKLVAVQMDLENTLNRENRPTGSLQIGFRELRLKTDKGNVYRGSGNAYFSPSTPFRPGQTTSRSISFEIREEESPVELWAYRLARDSLALARPASDEPPDFIFELPPARPEQLDLPYSWEEQGFRVTLVGLTQAPSAQPTVAPGARSTPVAQPPPSGYKLVAAQMNLENALNRENSPAGSLQIGFRELRLRTNEGNIYRSTGNAFFSPSAPFRPGQATSLTIAFEIREEESPAELLGYRMVPGSRTAARPGPDDLPDYVFEVTIE